MRRRRKKRKETPLERKRRMQRQHQARIEKFHLDVKDGLIGDCVREGTIFLMPGMFEEDVEPPDPPLAA